MEKMMPKIIANPKKPLFPTVLRKKSCSVPRLWSCLCLCHKFDVLCGGGAGNKCVCWSACEQNAQKTPGFNVEDADQHAAKLLKCECRLVYEKYAEKNEQKKIRQAREQKKKRDEEQKKRDKEHPRGNILLEILGGFLSKEEVEKLFRPPSPSSPPSPSLPINFIGPWAAITDMVL